MIELQNYEQHNITNHREAKKKDAVKKGRRSDGKCNKTATNSMEEHKSLTQKNGNIVKYRFQNWL